MLKEILERNFEFLGYKLESFDKTHTTYGTPIYKGVILCPCGNREVFSVLADGSMPIESEVAVVILSKVASREHLEKDAAEGTILDIDKHVFKGLI